MIGEVLIMDYVSIHNIRFYQTSHDKININQPMLVRVSAYIYMINVSCDFHLMFILRNISIITFLWSVGFYYDNKLSEK